MIDSLPLMAWESNYLLGVLRLRCLTKCMRIVVRLGKVSEYNDFTMGANRVG